MKLNLTVSALVLALAGTATFAQGMEGHQIGYNDESQSASTFSTRSGEQLVIIETRDTFEAGNLRAEEADDVTVTVYPSTPNERYDQRPTR